MAEHTEIQVNPKHPRYLGIENALSMIVPDTHIFVAFRATIKAPTPDDVQIWVDPGGFYGLMTYEDYARWPHMQVAALEDKYHAHLENSTILTRLLSPIMVAAAEAQAALDRARAAAADPTRREPYSGYFQEHVDRAKYDLAEALKAEQGRPGHTERQSP